MFLATAVSLVLLSSPAPAPQVGASAAPRVKEAFVNLEGAWAKANDRPKLWQGGWSIVGGFISGDKNKLGWTLTMKKDQTVAYTIVGDKQFKALFHAVRMVGAPEDEFTMFIDDQPFISNFYTAREDGKYTFNLYGPKGTTAPAFGLIAFTSEDGYAVSTASLKEIGDDAKEIYTQAADAETGMVAPLNIPSLYCAPFGPTQTRSIANINIAKAPYVFFGAVEGEREGLQMSVLDKKGTVLAKDPADEDFAYVVGDKPLSGGSLSMTNKSKKPRLGMIGKFVIK